VVRQGFQLSYGWHYEFRGNVATREDQVVAAYPTGMSARFAWPGRYYVGRHGLEPKEAKSSDPLQLVRYELTLGSGRDTTLSFLYPAEPGPASYAALLNSLSVDTLLARSDAVWAGQFAGVPDLSLGQSRLTSFVRGNLGLTFNQVQEGMGMRYVMSNKDGNPEVEPLDVVRVVRLWHRLGLDRHVRDGLAGLRALHRDGGVLLSRRDGRAATAGLLGLEAELAANPVGEGAEVPWPTLDLFADSLSRWLSPDAPRPASLIELATGTWALEACAIAADVKGRPDGATRHGQARIARGLLVARLGLLPDSVLVSGDAAALGWLDLSGGLPAARLGLLRDAAGWQLREGLVAVGDSAWIGRSLDRAEALPNGSLDGARALLAVVLHSTVQGGLPATLCVSRRSFDRRVPPEAAEGARAVREWLDRVISDSLDVTWLGRGLPAAAPGESVVVGPLRVRGGLLRVRAVYGERRASWTWAASGVPVAQGLRVCAPPGAKITFSDGAVAPDSSYARFGAEVGHGEVRWGPGGGSPTLATLFAELAGALPTGAARPGRPGTQRRR
jgi:hypothetical protein